MYGPLREVGITSETPYQLYQTPTQHPQTPEAPEAQERSSLVGAAFAGPEAFGSSSGSEFGASLGDHTVERFGQGGPHQHKAYVYIEIYVYCMCINICDIDYDIYIYIYIYVQADMDMDECVQSSFHVFCSTYVSIDR